MTTLQQQQINLLQQCGWQVAEERDAHVELVHLSPSLGAFSVTRVYPAGEYSWEGSYPLAKLPVLFPALSGTAVPQGLRRAG